MSEEIRWEQRFENFQQSIRNLEETINCVQQEGLNKIYTMALIQAFEISFELAWKTMKDYLEFDGIKTTTPREVIKSAFSNEVIADGQVWIDMLEARNKTSHTYQEPLARQLANDIMEAYMPLFTMLEKFLQGKING